MFGSDSSHISPRRHLSQMIELVAFNVAKLLINDQLISTACIGNLIILVSTHRMWLKVQVGIFLSWQLVPASCSKTLRELEAETHC